MNRAVTFIVIAALAASAGAYLYRSRVQPPVAPMTLAEPAPLVLAEALPSISLADRDGKMRSFADWQGRALIVNFWATWCAPCRREIPLLERLQREHGADGFQVIGIAVDFRDKVLAYADEMRIDYPLLIGEQEALDVAAALGIDVVGLPVTVFSDTQGRIIAAHLGELTEEQAAVIVAAIRKVNSASIAPDQARREIESSLKRLRTASLRG